MRLACCHRYKGISIDYDEHDRVVTYNGLESCIINSCSYDNESGTGGADGCPSYSIDEDASSSSSSKDTFTSFSSEWLTNESEEHPSSKWKIASSPKHFYFREKPAYTTQFSDVETMKERFAKLLLGEDVSGGCQGHNTALAISHAITNLAGSVFGELWTLEPLSEERKCKWYREMDWFLSPANYMVELVPAKQSGANGGTLEIMTPKARSDIHMNLPALRQLDSMLIETLDSMVNMEFWYAVGSSRAEGRNGKHNMRWWLPSPRVPLSGLSASQRKKLDFQGKFVQQILKAIDSINQNILLEMSVPDVIADTIPKSARASLGNVLYRVITSELGSAEEILSSLNLKTEHDVLETANRLEAAIFIWKQRISLSATPKNSWPFSKDFEQDKIEEWCERAEALLQLLKIRHPNLPHTFLDASKVQYNKDVGHSILEAYSRVLRSLAFRILSRLEEIIQEDDLCKPVYPDASFKFECFSNMNGLLTPETLAQNDGCCCNSSVSKASDDFSDSESRSSTIATPSTGSSRAWSAGEKFPPPSPLQPHLDKSAM